MHFSFILHPYIILKQSFPDLMAIFGLPEMGLDRNEKPSWEELRSWSAKGGFICGVPELRFDRDSAVLRVRRHAKLRHVESLLFNLRFHPHRSHFVNHGEDHERRAKRPYRA